MRIMYKWKMNSRRIQLSKRPSKDEYDDHVYCHLNKVPIDHVNQELTRI